MKKVLLTLLAIVVIVGALGTVGFAGYQYGYRQGALTVSNRDSNAVAPGFPMNPHGMMMQNRGFDRDFGRGDFGMMGRGPRGFGFFTPIRFLLQIVFWALVIWAVYTLVNRSGWRLTKVQPAPAATIVPSEPVVENKETPSQD